MFGIRKYKPIHNLPDMLEIEPTETCNLRCRMCHVSYMKMKKPPLLDVNILKKLNCMKGKFVRIGSAFEPMIHPEFKEIIKWIIKYDCEMEMITNGTRLSKENRSILADARIHTLQLSFDGIRKETFENIRRRANYQEIIDNILITKSELDNKDTYFAINSTMMRSNMYEIPEIIQFWDQNGFDEIRFITMVIRDESSELLGESLYPIRNEYFSLLDTAAEELIRTRRKIAIRSPYYKKSPLHELYPDRFIEDTVVSENKLSRFVPLPHQKYQLGEFPGMPLPCRSPFTSARILANGDVQLCYKFTIGNLHESSFEDIWFGKNAEKIRKELMKDAYHCNNCDHYRFCLHSRDIDIEDKSNYFQGNLMQYAEGAYVN